MKFTLPALAVASAFGLVTSMASAYIWVSDTTDRRVNDTNVGLFSFVPFGNYYSGASFSGNSLVGGSLYLRWTMSNFGTNSANPNSWAGLHLYNSGTEGLLVGKAAGGFIGYSAFANGGSYSVPTGGTSTSSFDLKTANPDAGKTYQSILAADVTTFAMRIDFNANGRDLVTIYLNPDLTTDMAHQSVSRTTSFYYNAACSDIYLREGGPSGTGVNFKNIYVADNEAQIGFTVPAPGAATLLGLASVFGARRRKA